MSHSTLRISCAAALLLAVLSLGAQPPPPSPLTATERDAAALQLATALEESFVFPDVGAAYAKMLRERVQTKAYADLTEPAAFATKVTADLQAVSKDGHLKLDLRSAFGPGPGGPGPGGPGPGGRGPGGPGPRPAGGGAPPSFGEALAETKMIGEVAYLKFNHFPNDPDVAARARKFLLDHAGQTKAIVLDARDSRGGTVMIMDAILPLLFAENTTLVRMDTRAAAEARMRPPGGGPPPAPPASMVPQPAPEGIVRRDHVVLPDASEKRLQKVPVFYLTTKLTRSAAEHFALALQRTGRGVVIGETTAGAGHFGTILPIGERFGAFLPVGRSYDPDNNRGWEGSGIVPNVPIAPAQALDEALRRAGAAKSG